MKSAVETLSPTRAKLTVEVPFEELKPSLDAAYKKIAQQINVPGFRKGKVPPTVIDRQVGRGAVLDEAINDALPKLYVEALQANELEPLAQPEIDITKFEDNETLEFTAEVDIRPEIELPDYTGLEVTVDDVEVTDQDVEEQVQSLRERFASLTEVERAAADGDFVVIDLVATQGRRGRRGRRGQRHELPGRQRRHARRPRRGPHRPVGRRARPPSPPSSSAATCSARTSTSRSRSAPSRSRSSPSSTTTSPRPRRSSTRSTSSPTTSATRLSRGKRLEQAAAARDAVLEKLLDLVDVPLPETVVDAELTARREQIEQQLAMAGMTMEQYLDDEEQTVDEFEADLEKRVRDAVAAQFVLDQVAKTEEIGVNEGELQEHLMRRAQQSGQNPQEFIQHMIEHNHIPEMVSEVVRGKALASHRRVRHGHRRVRQPRRAEEPAARRHHRRPGRARPTETADGATPRRRPTPERPPSHGRRLSAANSPDDPCHVACDTGR